MPVFPREQETNGAREDRSRAANEPKATAPGAAKRIEEGNPLLPPQPERKRVLGLVAMSAIIWFNVSGGPSGSEEIIAAAGPITGFGLMLVFVACYSIPQALMTAELSTTFADNGGYSLWVKAAFGDFWAVQESFWSFSSGVADSALYPVLFYLVCQKLVRWAAGYGTGLEQTSCTVSLFQGARFGLLGHHRNPMLCAATDWMCAAEWGCKVLILLVFAGPNLVSTKLVGTSLVSLVIFVVRHAVAPVLASVSRLTLQPHPRRSSPRTDGAIRRPGRLGLVADALGLSNHLSQRRYRLCGAAGGALLVNNGLRLGLDHCRHTQFCPWHRSRAHTTARHTWTAPHHQVRSSRPSARCPARSRWPSCPWWCARVCRCLWRRATIGFGGAGRRGLSTRSWHSCAGRGLAFGQSSRRRYSAQSRTPWTLSRQRTALFRHAPWIAQVGNYGMFSAEFLEDTHQLEGMACVGLAPRIFQTRSKRFGTPVNAMLFQLVLLVFLVGLDFRAILCAPAVPAEPSLPHALHSRAPEPRSSFLLGASTISSRPSQICSSSLRAYRCAIASLTCLAPSASGVRIGWSWP